MTEHKRSKRKRAQNGAFAVMVILMVLMIFSTVLLFIPEEDPKKKNTDSTPTAAPTQAVTPVPEETEMLAVILDVDPDKKLITVYDVKEEEPKKLIYVGSTTFFDGYGIQQTAAQLEKGSMYRITIDTKEEWISTACEAVDRRENPENTEVWEKIGVEYMTIAPDKISFRGQHYRYGQGVCVMSNGKQIALEDIQPQADIVTVRGVDQVIYEIEVTKGHGYITLINHEDFIGGMIMIGSTRIDSVYESSSYLVREGTYEVSVECGEFAGMEDITVERDATAVFDLYEYGSGSIRKGWLTIHVDPSGADLYIDGMKTAYTNGVELEYGTYQFEFAEGGYVSYKATVLIDQPKQSISAYLTEQQNNETKPPEDDPTTDPTGDEEEVDNMNIVSVSGLEVELEPDQLIYILGPKDADIYLDGHYLGKAPMNFEKVIGAYVIKVVRTDGAEKQFRIMEAENGQDSFYNFSWID